MQMIFILLILVAILSGWSFVLYVILNTNSKKKMNDDKKSAAKSVASTKAFSASDFRITTACLGIISL